MCSEIETIAFIQQGDSYLAAAQCLFAREQEYSRPGCFLNPAVILCHFGIEFLLKACLSWENKSVSKTHDLVCLAEQIKFINLTDESKMCLNQLYAAFYTRYAFDDGDYQKTKTILDGITETTTNTQILPGEVGTDEFNKAVFFYRELLNSMPHNLKHLFDKHARCFAP